MACKRRQLKAMVKSKSFHNTIKFTLLMGQMFAIMPVNGITKVKENELYFSWKSWKVWYSVCLILCLLIPMYASFCDLIETRATINKITAVVFFGNSITVHILFIMLAKNWPNLMNDWHRMELGMEHYGWPQKMNLRIKIMTIIMLLIATIEHVISVVSHFIISNELKNGQQDIFEYFFVIIAFPQVFKIFQYSVWLGCLMQVITFASTFSWTYIDLFISLIGASLALRFQQVADRVEAYIEEKISNEHLWRKLREDYVRLCILCNKLNKYLSSLILLSFSSNLFYILVQLFHSIKYIEDPVEKIYFFLSFGFLIGRTVCVCLYGAWINEESQRPLVSLNSVPSHIYNIEIKRFMIHITFCPTSLSGKHFFYLTRGLVLSIGGTIMTYELVFIQYFGSYQHEVNNSDNISYYNEN